MRRSLLLSVALIVSATLTVLPVSGQKQGKEKEARISVAVNLVQVTVTVTDPFDRIIVGLQLNNFEVYENGKRQEIVKLSSEDGPVSVVIVLDTSGSMRSKIDPAKVAATNFVKGANPQDEFSLVYFDNGRAAVATAGFVDAEELRSKLLMAAPRGKTPLVDALYLALSQMRNAQKGNRRAIIIISDGGDNHSRYTEKDLKSLIKEADTQIYAVGLFESVGYRTTPEEMKGPAFLTEITDMTGGRTFTIQNVNSLENVVSRIGEELRNQYVLAYIPVVKDWGSGKNDNKEDWRKIKVKVVPPRGLPRLDVRAKSGYYAPVFGFRR